MKSVDIDYLDGVFTVSENEPSTIPELVELIGEDSVVDETTSNLRYRNKYPRVYRLVSKAIEAAPHSFSRAVVKQVPRKDGTLRDVKESEMDHIRRFVTSGEDQKTSVATLFAEIAPAQPLYVKGERAGGGGKVSQSALDAANKFFAAGDETVEARVSIIESRVPGYKVGRDADENVTPESLARGIMALQRQLAKEAADAASALLK